jgi:hypothetical protein
MPIKGSSRALSFSRLEEEMAGAGYRGPALAENLGDTQCDVGERQGSQGLATPNHPDVSVSVLDRIPVDLDRLGGKIQQPGLRDAGASIEDDRLRKIPLCAAAAWSALGGHAGSSRVRPLIRQ